MIVVAIIGLLAALSIPNLLRSRVNSNESVAKSSLRTLSTALENFRTAQDPPTYPPDLASLAANNPPYVDSALASGMRQGYRYTYRLVNFSQFELTGTPVIPRVTGASTYFVDESGVVRLDNVQGTPIE